MDENEYRDTCRTVNPFPCSFRKAMLARQCGCEYLVHHHIAEREALGCAMPSAQADCERLLDFFRRNARFALKLVGTPTAPLPHGKEIKVQVGGLRGIAQAVARDDATRELGNVSSLVRKAMTQYGGMEKLPHADIIKEIAHHEGRPRRGRRRRG
uniref:Uncharacterized protein n=1 Tax=Candidatus Kentrum sp. DK TaxID=2126562 RepID=A0A450S269_9GAMM|nr:MAG: hypothetical protein BECKDK2373C_GA0170839_101256 [Candidatus Kentron sp. DK]